MLSFSCLLAQLELPSWVPQNLLMQATVVAAVVWLGMSAFILWRRSVTNLTPVDVPSVNGKVQPEFLQRDVKGQQAAVARSKAADAELTDRELQRQAALASGESPDQLSQPSRNWQIMGLVAVLLAITTLATVLIGAFMPESAIGRYVSSSGGLSVFTEHPVSVGISLVVVALKLILQFSAASQQPAAT